MLRPGPVTSEDFCDPCELGDLDYENDEANAVLLEDGATGRIVKWIQAGVIADSIPDTALNQETGEVLVNQFVPVAKTCAQRIVAGECSRFLIADDGQIQRHEPEEIPVEFSS